MASNTKHRKNHKQKLAARNNRLANDKVRAQKAQRDFLMNLIKQEQEKGMFENTQNFDGPIIDGPTALEGPTL